MSLPTNRMPGDIIRAVDVNQIAEVVNELSDSAASVLGTADLNTVKEPGWYAAETNATLARNYPVEGLSGVLEVRKITPGGTYLVQTFVAATTAERTIYTRVLWGGTWRPWVAQPTMALVETRINERAGEIVQAAKIGDQLGTADLNTVTEPGWYAAAANATLARNYPVEGSNGVLEVRAITMDRSYLIQTFVAATTITRTTYTRVRWGSGAWSPWTLEPSMAAVEAYVDEQVAQVSPRPLGVSDIPNIFTILAGTPDEEMARVPGGSGHVSDQARRVGTGADRGWEPNKTGGGTTTFAIDFPGGLHSPPAQALCVDLSVTDATQILAAGRYFHVRLHMDSGLTVENRFEWSTSSGFYDHKWTNDKGARLVNGRQKIRIGADFATTGTSAAWGNIYKVDILINSATTVGVTLHHLYLETPPKARLLVIDDRGYKTFYDYAYPKLKAAGIPVTFAVDPGLFGTGTGQHLAMTEAEIHEVARENNNSISFHAWEGQVTEFLSADELVKDTIRCIKWLQQHGYSGRMWRAAFTQGRAPNWEAISDLVLAARSGMDTQVRDIGQWPPIHRMKIPAQQIDNTMTARTALRFEAAQRTHGLMVPFFHGIGLAQANITESAFDEWLALAVAGIEDGWLEPVTFEQVYAETTGALYP